MYTVITTYLHKGKIGAQTEGLYTRKSDALKRMPLRYFQDFLKLTHCGVGFVLPGRLWTIQTFGRPR